MLVNFFSFPGIKNNKSTKPNNQKIKNLYHLSESCKPFSPWSAWEASRWTQHHWHPWPVRWTFDHSPEQTRTPMNFHNRTLLQHCFYYYYELGAWYNWCVLCWIAQQRQRVSLAELEGGRDFWLLVTMLRKRTDAPSASWPLWWFWVPKVWSF